VVLLLFLIFPFLVDASVYIVAKDGSGDFVTIQGAADVALAGDTVLIKGGTYEELVQPIHSGTASDYITYKNYDNNEVVIDGGSWIRETCIKVQNCSYLRFEDLTVSGALYAGFYVEGPASNLILENLTSENNIHPERGAGYGIWFMGWDASIEDCEIRYCVVRNNSSHGIFLYRSNYNILIDQNHVSYSGMEEDDWGHNVKTVVWNEHDPSTGPVGITITNNELEHARTQGIMTWNARNVLIQDNYIHHNGATGIQIENGTRYFVVERNLCEWNQQSYNTETGIWVDDAYDGLVQHNIMRHNQVGLKISKCERVLFRHNVIHENNRDNPEHFHNGGLFHLAYDATINQDIVVVHNTVFDIGNPAYNNINIGLFEYYGTPIKNVLFLNNVVSEIVNGNDIEVNCPSPTFSYFSDYNTFHNSLGLSIKWQGLNLTWPQYQLFTGLDGNSLTENPMFVDTANGDFQLEENSPCIDTGTYLTKTTSLGTGTVLPIEDTRFFCDGFGLIEGDLIAVGSNNPVRIVSVNPLANTLTLETPISWALGDDVSYPYSGLAPDMGAYEAGTTIPDISGFFIFILICVLSLFLSSRFPQSIFCGISGEL